MSQPVGTTDARREIVKERAGGKDQVACRYARNRVNNHESGGTTHKGDEEGWRRIEGGSEKGKH